MNTTAARGQSALAMNEAVQQNGYAMVSTEDDNVQEDDASSNTSTYGHRRLANHYLPTHKTISVDRCISEMASNMDFGGITLGTFRCVRNQSVI